MRKSLERGLRAYKTADNVAAVAKLLVLLVVGIPGTLYYAIATNRIWIAAVLLSVCTLGVVALVLREKRWAQRSISIPWWIWPLLVVVLSILAMLFPLLIYGPVGSSPPNAP